MSEVIEKQNYNQNRESAAIKPQIMVNTRFGEVKVNSHNRFTLTGGPLGMESFEDFCLIEFEKTEGPFLLFQSVDNQNVGFVVIPTSYSNSPIKKADLDEICTNLAIEENKLLALFIVSFDKNENNAMSINLRAPIILNIVEKKAYQYVIASEEYSIKHAIS